MYLCHTYYGAVPVVLLGKWNKDRTEAGHGDGRGSLQLVAGIVVVEMCCCFIAVRKCQDDQEIRYNYHTGGSVRYQAQKGKIDFGL